MCKFERLATSFVSHVAGNCADRENKPQLAV